jgi:glucose/arabinose dehydrogenase
MIGTMSVHKFLVLGPVMALALLLLVGARTAFAAEVPAGFQDEVVLEKGLQSPTSFKFAPDGRTFVAEQDGEIKVYPKEAGPESAPTTFADLRAKVYQNGDHGLLGLALDPKFDAGRPYVYALYAFDHELGTPISKPFVPKWGDTCAHEYECIVSGRLVQLTAEGDKAKESGGEVEEKVLLEGWCQQSNSHSIGDVEFGPEGALFVSGGEGAAYANTDYGQYENLCGDPPGPKGTPLTVPTAEGGSLRSQSLSLLSGTLLRVDPDTGEGWPGNPLAASSNANARRIIGDGFRNPFRFAINPRSGEAFVNNVGNVEYEEIDRFPLQSSTVYNSGWPCFEGLERNFQFEILGLEACDRLYNVSGSTSPPFFHYSHRTVVAPGDPCPTYNGSAISGSAFYEGSTYPEEYDGALFFADSVRGCIYAMKADEEGDPDPSRVVPFLYEPTEYIYPGVDIEQGPGGDLFYARLNGNTIDRISYDPGAPQARLTASPEFGATPLHVQFNAGESTGPAGDTLAYTWDLDGDGEFDDGTGVTQQRTYTESTNVNVAVRVQDVQTGKTSIAHKRIYPGDTPPQVTIAAPDQSLTWGVGQLIHFAGSAIGTIENEGTHKLETGKPMPSKYLYWKVRLLHCPFAAEHCHEHPVQVFPALPSGDVVAPDHEYPSFLHFFMTATDARGLSSETDVKVAARPVSFQFRSVPSGIALVTSVKTATTPFELPVIEDSPTTIAAPETAEVGGVTYTFDRWSDGGARVHSVPATGPAEYTAYYDAPAGLLLLPTVAPAPPASAPKAPELHKHPGKSTKTTTAKFAFGAAAGLRFRCKLDGKSFASCRSPRIYKHLKIGQHSFRVYAIDSTGARVTRNTQFSWHVLAAK